MRLSGGRVKMNDKKGMWVSLDGGMAGGRKQEVKKERKKERKGLTDWQWLPHVGRSVLQLLHHLW